MSRIQSNNTGKLSQKKTLHKHLQVYSVVLSHSLFYQISRSHFQLAILTPPPRSIPCALCVRPLHPLHPSLTYMTSGRHPGASEGAHVGGPAREEHRVVRALHHDADADVDAAAGDLRRQRVPDSRCHVQHRTAGVVLRHMQKCMGKDVKIGTELYGPPILSCPVCMQ